MGIFSSASTKLKNILRKTEPYFRTDMVYVTKQGFWSLAGQILASLASAAMVIVLTNILSKEAFGQYRFALSLISVLGVFSLPGISTAFTRSVARGERTDIPRLIKIQIFWGLLGSIVALLAAGYYFYKGDALFYACIATAAFLPFLQPFSIYGYYYKGKQDFKKSTIYGTIANIFQAMAVVGVALATRNFVAAVAAFLIAQIAPMLFFTLKIIQEEKSLVAAGSPADHSEEAIKYGKSLTSTQVISTIAGSIDKLLVGFFWGPIILAVYSIALAIPSHMVLALNTIPRIALPKFSKNSWDPEERKRIMRKLMIFFVALILPAAAYALLVPFVLPIVFRQYSEAIPVAVLLGILVIISPFNAMMDNIFQAKKFVKSIAISQTTTLLVFAAAFFVIAAKFGPSPMGAAVALLISEVVQSAVGLLLLKK